MSRLFWRGVVAGAFVACCVGSLLAVFFDPGFVPVLTIVVCALVFNTFSWLYERRKRRGG